MNKKYIACYVTTQTLVPLLTVRNSCACGVVSFSLQHYTLIRRPNRIWNQQSLDRLCSNSICKCNKNLKWPGHSHISIGESVVYKRGKNAKYYTYKFRWHGRVICVSTSQGDKRTARLLEAAHRTELAKAQVGLGVVGKDIPLFKDFAGRFKEAIETKSRGKPETVAFYTARLRYLLADTILPNCRLDKIDDAFIDDYKQRRTKTISRRGTPFAIASINKELTTLRRILRLAQKWKILTSVPGVEMLPGENERDFVLSYAQEEAYLNAAKGDLKDLAILLIDTGLRMGEALKLAVADVRLIPAEGAQYGFLTVRKRNSKNSKSRNVPLTSQVSQMLKGRITEVGTDLVFRRRDGSGRQLGQTWLNELHRDARAVLGLGDEFVSHSFRHTYGTRLGEAGVDAFTIAKLMGHSSVKMTQRYVHPSPEVVENAVSRLEAMSERKRQTAKFTAA